MSSHAPMTKHPTPRPRPVPRSLSAVDGIERRFLQPEIELAAREELKALQESRILELVPYAWENSAFYRELWTAAGVNPSNIKSLDDFHAQIPTFEKSDVQKFRDRTGDPFGGLLCVPADQLTSITSTSGTTSEPEFIPEIWSIAPPLQMMYARDLWEIGLRPGDRVLMSSGSFRNFWDEFYAMMGLVPIFLDAWIGQGELILKAIQKFQPAYMQLHLPAILEFERLESQYDMRSIFSCLKGASFAGQPMGPGLARKVREEWGLEVFSYTSAGDTGTAWEHREHDGYTLWEDTVLPESLRPDTDQAVSDGEIGELVATDLDNLAAPLIRYRSGDLVRLSRTPAASGRTHTRQRIVGRKGDETIISGSAIVLGDLWSAIEELPELSNGMFQIIRYSNVMDTLKLRVGYAPERTGNLEDLKLRLHAHLRQRLNVDSQLEMVTVDELLTRSSSVAKFPRVVKI